MGMTKTILLASAVAILAAACDERILPPPLDGEGGAGGEEEKPTPAPDPDTQSAKGGCPGNGAKCSGRW